MAHRIVFNSCYVDTTTSVAGTKRTFSLGQCSTDGKDKPLKNIDVDLALSVAEAGNGSIDWTDVVVDANDTESPTKFYGGSPQDALGGQIYLTQKFVEDNDIPKFPKAYRDRRYEFQAILKVPADPTQRKRYHGFHARVVDVAIREGKKQALLIIYDAGKSLEQPAPTPRVTKWLDLNNAAEVDAQSTTIKETPGSEGALFWEGVRAKEAGLLLPYDKKPASEME